MLLYNSRRHRATVSTCLRAPQRVLAALLIAVGVLIRTGVASASAVTPLFQSSTLACFRIPSVASDGHTTVLVAAEQRFSGRPVAYEQFQAEEAAGRGRVDRPIRCSDAGYINIVLRRSLDGGATWQPMQLVVDYRQFLGDDYKVALAGNPTLVWLPQNEQFLLLFAVTRSRGANNAAPCVFEGRSDHPACTDVPAEHGVWMTLSADRGATWTAPQPLTTVGGASEAMLERPGPGHGIILPSGRIVIGAYPNLLLSDDAAATWRYGAAAPRGETSVVMLDDGTVWALVRPPPAMVRRLGEQQGRSTWRLSAYSRDGGETYQSVVPDDRFPVPEVHASLLRVERSGGKGAGIAVAFPSPRRIAVPREIQADRRRLLVAMGDGMATKFCATVMDQGPAGYSDLVSMRQDRIAVVYEGALNGKSFGDQRAYIANILWKVIDVDDFDGCNADSGFFALALPLPKTLYD